jgi:tetratricopeptide (TPR) repeat protein
MEKSLKEMRLKKNIKKYDDSERDNCLITIAELNRNLGNFATCKELIKQLGRPWSWLKKQYLCECKAKNPFTIELLTQRELNLDKDTRADEFEYLGRAEKYLATYSGRRDPKKALADLDKAEELGISDLSFYNYRGLIYLNDLGDPKSAIADFTKALSLSDGERGASIASVFNNRACAYTAIGGHAAALADKQAAEIAKQKKDDSDLAALIKDDIKPQKQKQGKSKLTEV